MLSSLTIRMLIDNKDRTVSKSGNGKAVFNMNKSDYIVSKKKIILIK